MFTWSNDKSIELIENYKTLPCLWDHSDAKYKCRNEKHDAWAKLCDVTGANEAEVKRKIKNMVAQFFRERKKYRSYKKSGAGAHFISKWFAYNYMLFLADKNKVRHCTEKGFQDEIQDDASSDESDNVEYNELESQCSTLEETILDETTNNDDMSQPDPSPENNESQSSSGPASIGSQMITSIEGTIHEPPKARTKVFKSPPLKKNYKRKSTDDRQEEAYNILQELQNKKPRNRFQVFGEHIAFKIQGLRTEHAQNTVEHLISNILWEASMGKYDQPPHFTPYAYAHQSTAQFTTTQPPACSPATSQISHHSSDALSSYESHQSSMLSPGNSHSADSQVLVNNDNNSMTGVDSNILYEAIRDAGVL